MTSNKQVDKDSQLAVIDTLRPPGQLSHTTNLGSSSLACQQASTAQNSAIIQQCGSGGLIKRQRLELGFTSFSTLSNLVQNHQSVPSQRQRAPYATTTGNTQPTQASLRSPSSKEVPVFPLRPRELTRRADGAPSHRTSPTQCGPVQVKAYLLEPSKLTPEYGNGSPADFFPWLGHQPEDILNEQSTKSGYFDKSQISQNEANTARSVIWSPLKHKSGLHVLSSLYISIIDKRLVHVSTPPKCTFKPPPRVTLPDTKREAWLRDLAKPTTALRRLSRTIPHGIRGKVLLDHCLAKRIPTRRAVWLAKCVGANEIRAFKRKGSAGAFSAGGESKWIKDWTSNVEDFLEALILSIYRPDWIAHLAYGLQLVMHILSEDLLDQDHFFEWIVTSLEKSDSETLRVWMLVTQAYANTVKHLHLRNRQLLEALLHQLEKVTHPDSTLILTTLKRSIYSVMSSLVPNHLLGTRDKKTEISFQCLQMYNVRIPRSAKAEIETSYQTSRQRLISLMDTQKSHVNIRTLSVLAHSLVHNFNTLVSTIVEWSTTLHRIGISRMYLALRLLRQWKIEGFDLHAPILCVMSNIRHLTRLHPSSIYKFFGELVRSRLLSLGKYLQWLIARGVCGSESDANENFEVHLLYHIPLYGLQDHVLNLRRMILMAGGQSTSMSWTEENLAQSFVASKIEYLRHGVTSPGSMSQECNMNTLSGTAKYGLSRWLRQVVADAVHHEDHGSVGAADVNPRSSHLSISDFRVIRNTLETLEDHPILADILGMISLSGDLALLEFVADTVNCHIDVFQAIGVAESLFRQLLSRLQTFPIKGVGDKPLLVRLIDLAERVPPLSHRLVMLRHELRAREAREVVVASSPVSYKCVQACFFSDTASIDDMERWCCNETTMDPQNITLVFSSVSGRLQAELQKNQRSFHRCLDLLAQLRTFNLDHFDSLMFDWLWPLTQSADRSYFLTLLIPFVCLRILDLGRLLETIQTRLEGIESQALRSRLLFDVLSTLLSDMSGDIYRHIPYLYRFSRAREQIILRHPTIVVRMVRCSLDLYLVADPPLRQTVKNMALSLTFLQALRTILLHNESTIWDLGDFLGNSRLIEIAMEIMHRLLASEPSIGLPAPRIDKEMDKLLHEADDFNIQICKLKLLILITQFRNNASDGLGTYEKASIKVIREVILSSPSGLGLWTRLISVLPQDFAENLRSGSLHELFTMMPSWVSGQQIVSSSLKADSWICNSLLASIDVAESRVSSAASTTFIMEIIRKVISLRTMPQVLALPREHSLTQCIDSGIRLADQEEINNLCDWIQILLRLLEIHYDRITHHKLPQQHISHLVLSLSLLLITPFNTNHATLSTHIFNIIALYSENLNSESRSYCATILRDQHNVRDVRFQHIFGMTDCDQGDSLCVTNTWKSALLFPLDASSGIPHAFRRWELLQDATPTIGENDTSLSLHLFQARKVL